jgi:fucose permease
VLGSATACAALVGLSLVSPRLTVALSLAGILILGFGAGLVCNGLFHAISRIYRHDPAATVNIIGVVFTFGSLVMALIVGGAFYVYTVGSTLLLLALVPGVFAGLFARSRVTQVLDPNEQTWSEAWADFRSPVAGLFALVLFFQFGNEWSIAGWLAVFLIQRIGVSPATSLMMLALYWLALLVGRVMAQFLLSRVQHARMLGFSILAALFGCVVLGFTRTAFGAVSGILFVGGGFAVVYPLVVEMIGNRFPRFHPGLFNGIFAFAMTGGLLAPWTLGFLADAFGIGVLMLIPLGGTAMVALSLCALWIEAKLTGSKAAA